MAFEGRASEQWVLRATIGVGWAVDELNGMKPLRNEGLTPSTRALSAKKNPIIVGQSEQLAQYLVSSCLEP
jgi:hypothetical protein